MIRLIITLLFVSLLSGAVFSNEDSLKAINEQVWARFTQSYKAVDGDMHASLYHPDIVRASPERGQVMSGEAYKNMLKRMFAMRSERGAKGADISFRFLERHHNEDSAYEVGIYQMQGTGRDGEPFTSYGKFQVVLKKVDGSWKILFDTDVTADQQAWNAAPIRITDQEN